MASTLLNDSDPILSAGQFALAVFDDKIDRYSGFDHRVQEGQLSALAAAPWWVSDEEDRRRLVSYNVAAAALETVGRIFHDRDDAFADYYQAREHGHADVLASRRARGIMGEDPDVAVRGADLEVPSEPPLPDKPTLADDADEVEVEAHEAAMRMWRLAGSRSIEEWEVQFKLTDRLRARQEALSEWARRSHLWRKMKWIEGEDTVPKGDGVLLQSLADDGDPQIDAVQPQTFFRPRAASDSTDRWPDRIHLAYEYTENDPVIQGAKRTFIRRTTYELLPVEGGWISEYSTERSAVRCFWTDAVWDITPGSATTSPAMLRSEVDSFPLDDATFLQARNPFIPNGPVIEARAVPLPIDWIPVTHFKNTSGGRYGRSEFARRMGLLDDMVAADTSAALVSILCGEPPISIKDGQPGTDLEFGPAASISGDASKIGFAQELMATIEYQNMLERQFVKITGLSSELAGRENREQSGRAIGLKMTPYRQGIEEGREARDEPAGTLMRDVQRLALIGGVEGFVDDRTVHEANIRWGQFIPEDQSQVVEQIIALRDRDLLTDQDVYDWLIEAGFSFRNPRASLAFLRSIDVKVATSLAEIIGHKGAASYLDRPLDVATVPLLAASGDGDAPVGSGVTNRPTSSTDQPSSNQLPKRERSQPNTGV